MVLHHLHPGQALCCLKTRCFDVVPAAPAVLVADSSEHLCVVHLRLDLVPQFFEFLSLQHSNNNVHNIRLCRLVIANADLSSQELAEMRVAEKVKARNHSYSTSPALCCRR